MMELSDTLWEDRMPCRPLAQRDFMPSQAVPSISLVNEFSSFSSRLIEQDDSHVEGLTECWPLVRYGA
jgi:hypothetical protein